MKQKAARTAVCPRCGNVYHHLPALSRLDNETLICPDCGTREALSSIGVETDEQEKLSVLFIATPWKQRMGDNGESFTTEPRADVP